MMPRHEEIDPPEPSDAEIYEMEHELHIRALEEAPRQAPCPASRYDTLFCQRLNRQRAQWQRWSA